MSFDIHTDKLPDASAETDFDKLVNDILENPELLIKGNLTDDQVIQIQKRINPYARIGCNTKFSDDHKKVAACSYTNLREDYIRRFTMTSLVGFVFQMYNEWEVPANVRRWLPKGDKSTAEQFTSTELVEYAEGLLHLAKEIQAEEQKLDAQQSKVVALRHVATHSLHTMGSKATKRLADSVKECVKYPDLNEIIDKYPIPTYGHYEIPPKVAKDIIGDFLTHWFKFDPINHVKSGHSPVIKGEQVANEHMTYTVDVNDPSRMPLEVVREQAKEPIAEHREAVNYILSSKDKYNAVAALLNDSELTDSALLALSCADTFRQYLLPIPKDSPARHAVDIIPPQDTFHRWNYYTEVNYEELRTATSSIYPEKPDLDWAIALWDEFEGTSEEVQAAFDKFCRSYQDELPSSVKTIEFGSWALLADFKENRQKMQFYNKNTEVLKRILDRHSEDKKLGADLMRKRVFKAKADNIARDGPDAPGLKEYKRNLAEQGKDLTSKGTERVISVEEMKRLEKAKGDLKAAHELQILDEYESTIKTLTEEKKHRTLTSDEEDRLKYATDNIDRAREMIEVPDNAIQIDVFTNDPKSGSFVKSHFYTKSDEAEEARS